MPRIMKSFGPRGFTSLAIAMQTIGFGLWG